MASNTTTTSLLKYLGLVGTSGARTGSLVPRAATPDAEQRLWREFEEAGKVSDPDIWTKFNNVMRRPTTFDAMLQLWDEMAAWDLVAAALVEIVDEATQTDSNSPGTLWYQCNDKDFEEELNDMVQRLDIETVIPSQIWHIAAYGNHFEKLEYAPTQGVMGMSFVHPMDIRRYWLERNRKCIGFRWQNHKPDKEDVFVMPDNTTPVERVAIASGQNIEDLWYPWDFLHFRRMFRMRISEHGEPIFAEADGVYKKLRLAVDQMVVHRCQIQPDRYAINIDVQEQPPYEQLKTVQRWRQALRAKLAFGQTGQPGELNAATDFQSFYNAWALDTVLYLAQPKGFNNTITKLQGTQQVPDVYDIELLTDLFYSIIGMPRAWFGSQRAEGGTEAPSGRALLAQDIRFLRKIKSIRRPVTEVYEWLGYFHAILKGINIANLDIKAMMPPIGSLEEQMKMELLGMQADVLTKLSDVMTAYNLPKEAWIEVIFKRYMHLPDDVVNVFVTALPAEIGAETEGGGKQESAPYTYRLLRRIEEKVGASPELRTLFNQLKQTIYGDSPSARQRLRERKKDHYVWVPQMKERDIIVSSYGRHPMSFKRAGSNGAPQSKAFSLMDSSGQTEAPLTEAARETNPYRRWMAFADAK